MRFVGGVRRCALAGLATASGGRTGDLLWGRDRLTVLAYHRIGDAGAPGMEFDPGVFSATAEMFERQMRYVASRFNVIGLHDLAAHLDGGRALPERPLLITFDDGYRDNHELAFPVLRALGLPAVVFLVSGAIGTDRVMWWDEVPYLLARSARATAELPLLGRRTLEGAAARGAVRAELFAALKAVEDDVRAAAVDELRRVLEVDAPRPERPLFMDWDDVAELVANGIECQPHTVDHPLLTRVDAARAHREIRGSAEEVARRTGRPAIAFAYPNGSYAADTVAAVGDAGIRMAFTMRLGPCRDGDARRAPLQIPRVALEARDDWNLFRLKVSGVVSTLFGLRGLREPMHLGDAG